MNARKMVFVCMAFLCVIGTGLISQSTKAANSLKQAQTPNNPCTGLDVVFLVSYSNSMNGNDSVGIRKQVLETAIETIGDNAIYLCPGFQHRLAVVGFGDGEKLNKDENGLINGQDVESVVDAFIPPTVIAPTLISVSDWSTQKNNFFDKNPEQY